MKKIVVDLPYPTLDEVKENVRTARVISPAYSGLHGEITAIFQYIYHHFYFDKLGDDETAKTLLGISLAEMEHLDLLGKAILKLGVAPVFTLNPPYQFNPYDTRSVRYGKEPQKMLLEDITGELVAIEEYQKMLKLIDDENICALISRIILDEQLHVRVLKERLEKITGRKA